MKHLFTVLRWVLNRDMRITFLCAQNLLKKEYGRLQPPTPEERNPLLANVFSQI